METDLDQESTRRLDLVWTASKGAGREIQRVGRTRGKGRLVRLGEGVPGRATAQTLACLGRARGVGNMVSESAEVCP